MRLFLTTDSIGGVWHYSVMLAEQLTACGAAVRLGVIGRAPSPIQIAELSALENIDSVPVNAPFDWLAGSEASLAATRREIRASAAEWGADLIQINQPAFAGERYSIPSIAMAHSCVETWWRETKGAPAPDNWSWHRNAVRNGLRGADATVAPSAAFAAHLQKTYGLPKSPQVIRNGVRKPRYRGIKQPHVLSAGRAWDESKNLALLDRAAPLIDWPVYVAGARIRPEDGWQAQFNNVRCLGELGSMAMAREYAIAPIFISPSLYEPFGLAIAEAAHAGAALVLSDIATFRELWSDAALFFDPGNPADAARQTNRLIRDEALLARQSRAARQRVEQYTIDRTANEMHALYRCILAGRHPEKVPA